MANIKLVKLTSGLELIGDCTTSLEGVTIEAAFQVVVQPVNEKQFSIGLAPLSAAIEGADKGLTITRPWADIFGGVHSPIPSLIETYQRLTGAIITPSKPVLVK